MKKYAYGSNLKILMEVDVQEGKRAVKQQQWELHIRILIAQLVTFSRDAIVDGRKNSAS